MKKNLASSNLKDLRKEIDLLNKKMLILLKKRVNYSNNVNLIKLLKQKEFNSKESKEIIEKYSKALSKIININAKPNKVTSEKIDKNIVKICCRRAIVLAKEVAENKIKEDPEIFNLNNKQEIVKRITSTKREKEVIQSVINLSKELKINKPEIIASFMQELIHSAKDIEGEYIMGKKNGKSNTNSKELLSKSITLDFDFDVVDLLKTLTNDGKNNCILLESADVIEKIGEKSIGSAFPALRITGEGNKFTITALTSNGKNILKQISNDFDFCKNVVITNDKISGEIIKSKDLSSESEKMNKKTLADILRKINYKFQTKNTEGFGLYGIIAYDFIDQFENLPKNKQSLTKDYDIDMYYLDNYFMLNHKEKKITFSISAINEKDLKNQEVLLNKYTLACKKLKHEKIIKSNQIEDISIDTDTNKDDYVSMVKSCKEHILCGDVFQIVPSRTKIITTNKNPINIYKNLRKLNPSPYMFFHKSENGYLFGSSPETFIKVSGNGNDKKVEILPIAGTKSRGFLQNGEIDKDLDNRYENELKTDKKELAEHIMLVDLARNDIARVSIPGTRVVEKPHFVEKYSHVMHLVSIVSGKLKPGYDALHAYLASMNMGTLTGAPKVKAMEILRNLEKNKRGYYGGSIGYFLHNGNFDSAIIIRSIRVVNNTAYVRSGAGVVYDSVPEKEFEETEKKAEACIKAIKMTK